MIASARMYAVTPAVGVLWRRLLEGIADRAGQSIDVLDWPAPRPLPELWEQPGKAAVFMCGLPFSMASPQPEAVAVPVPALPHAAGRPVYWSELIVSVDSTFHHLSDTFGHRIAFTVPDSQSGYAAPLHHLMPSAGDEPLYREIIAPRITPRGALLAVTEKLSEVAAVDAWAFALMRHHEPDLTARVRVIARTEPTPIPLLIASAGLAGQLDAAILAAHDDPALKPLMEALLIEKFVQPQVDSYTVLNKRYESIRDFWRRQPFAEITDPAFAL